MTHHVTCLLLLMTYSWLSFKAYAAPERYFWHVTDFHLDVNYSSTGDAERMCWQPEDKKALPGGVFGDYRCDSPYRLVESAMIAMKNIGSQPDFILWTGDDKAHVLDGNFSAEIVFDIVSNLTSAIEKTFPGVPLVPVLGNHDWFPTHQLPPHEDPLYTKIADRWGSWLGEEGKDTFQKGGYYSVNVTASNITFLVLNTALYYQKNKQVKEDVKDPGQQFAWMKEKLQEARSSNRTVYITSHVPPGVFERHFIPQGWTWLKDPYNTQYIELIVEYSDVIIGQFFAHHHTDSFRIFYNKDGIPVSWLLVAPAVTPWNTTLSGVGPNNPGLRQIFYSTADHRIETFKQYYLNLSLANTEDKDVWDLEYDAKEAYNLTNGLTPESLHALVTSFKDKDRSTFNRYYFYNSVSYQSAVECNENCRQYHICAITNVNYQSFRQCYKNKWTINEDSSEDNDAVSLVPGMLLLLVVEVVVTWNFISY